MSRVGCAIVGCPGKVDVTVRDGVLVESPCPYCARRLLYTREVLGAPHSPECAICRGPIVIHPNGRVYRKYCTACEKLAARTRWQRCNAKRARDKQRAA